MFESVKEYSGQSCSQWTFLPSILSLFHFIIAACLVRSLIAQYKHKADLFIMEGINTSSGVTYFHWDVWTVENGIIYLSKTYQIHLTEYGSIFVYPTWQVIKQKPSWCTAEVFQNSSENNYLNVGPLSLSPAHVGEALKTDLRTKNTKQMEKSLGSKGSVFFSHELEMVQ